MSVARACKFAFVTYRSLPTNDQCQLDPETLNAAIEEDKEKGLIPFYVSHLNIKYINCTLSRIPF